MKKVLSIVFVLGCVSLQADMPVSPEEDLEEAHAQVNAAAEEAMTQTSDSKTQDDIMQAVAWHENFCQKVRQGFEWQKETCLGEVGLKPKALCIANIATTLGEEGLCYGAKVVDKIGHWGYVAGEATYNHVLVPTWEAIKKATNGAIEYIRSKTSPQASKDPKSEEL